MNINPIRYKSYYYDTESNMYYLNSRYYNPLIARFITPDSYEYIDINDSNTFNLYSYCNNNPVNYVDPEGNFGIITALAVTLVGVDLGATISDIVKIANNEVNATVESKNNVIIGMTSKQHQFIHSLFII